MGFSLGALYSHLGALRARHLILGSVSPFFLEDDDEPQRWVISYQEGNADTPADVLVGAREDGQMHRRASAVRDFYRQCSYTVVPECRRSRVPWTDSRRGRIKRWAKATQPRFLRRLDAMKESDGTSVLDNAMIANLYTAMLDRLGVKAERVGDSTGRLENI